MPGFDDFTTVIGVDNDHMLKLRVLWNNWCRHKPNVTERVVIFCDDPALADEITRITGVERIYVWQPEVKYVSDGTRWTKPQRQKMLSGFVHVPPHMVQTKYWLKLDLDVVAEGPKDWIDPSWFEGTPTIVAHRWSYTKPPNQMVDLDIWFDRHMPFEVSMLYPRLDIKPQMESSAVPHKRIISWCGFFHTEFTNFCSIIARENSPSGLLPVPSQDGYIWYMATRFKTPVKRVNMKARGWHHKSTLRSVIDTINEQEKAL